MTSIEFTSGIDATDLRAALDRGLHRGGNPIESFIDDGGGWPLRCCLADSALGEEIAIITWSPFPWTGASVEVGPEESIEDAVATVLTETSIDFGPGDETARLQPTERSWQGDRNGLPQRPGQRSGRKRSAVGCTARSAATWASRTATRRVRSRPSAGWGTASTRDPAWGGS